MADLGELRERMRQFSAERDWGQFHDPKSVLLALVGEVGELAELFQWLPAGGGRRPARGGGRAAPDQGGRGDGRRPAVPGPAGRRPGHRPGRGRAPEAGRGRGPVSAGGRERKGSGAELTSQLRPPEAAREFTRATQVPPGMAARGAGDNGDMNPSYSYGGGFAAD